MSSVKKDVYRVVLFVGGLGCDGSFFNPTIKKLKNKGSRYVVEYSNMVNMDDFITSKGAFYGLNNGSLMKSTSLTENFNLEIDNIVKMAKGNPNKTVLVKTRLDETIRKVNSDKVTFDYIAYESIEAQKIKLKYIINAIKNLDSSIEIVLIGHSQGGLVNLETAVEIPEKITEMVSISTPYSSVAIAKGVCLLDTIANIVNSSIYKLIENDDEIIKRYDASVTVLGTPSYFDNLKAKWNSLTSRPKLTVIAGISAHLMTSVYLFPFEVNHRYPFDCLVLGREQVDIENCTLHVLSKDGVTCYEDSDGFKKSCCTDLEFINEHDCDCTLPCFDISGAIFKSAVTELENLYNNKKFVALSELPVVKAVVEAKDGKPLSNEDYRPYYETVASEYSHLNIREAEKTIGILLGILM